MTGREHGRLLGLLFLVYVGFQLLISVFSAIVMFAIMGPMMEEISKMPRRAGEPDPAAFFSIFPIIMVFAFGLGIVFLIPALIAGLGLRGEKSSARIWAIIASCIALINVPIGTALGVYGLWFIFGEQGKAYFNNPSGYGSQPPPPPHSWQ